VATTPVKPETTTAVLTIRLKMRVLDIFYLRLQTMDRSLFLSWSNRGS
jgi:hypothetical protein